VAVKHQSSSSSISADKKGMNKTARNIVIYDQFYSTSPNKSILIKGSRVASTGFGVSTCANIINCNKILLSFKTYFRENPCLVTGL